MSLMKKGVYILILLVVVVGGWYWANQRTSPETGNLVQNPKETASETATEGGPEINPVSLPALMQKEFNGSGLQVGRVLGESEAYTRYYITYRSGELTISGIMNVPKGDGPFPLLVLNHGFIDPSVYTNGRGLRREQDYLARRGYVVIHPDYRNHADSDKDPENNINFRLGYTEDVINAVLAAGNSGLDFIDAQRVGMLGHSMGGGVTENILVVDPDLVDAAVLFAPVSSDQRDNFDKWFGSDTEIGQEIVERFGHYQNNSEFWDDLSAMNFFNRVEAPVMIHHGTADESVPLLWSQKLQQQMESADKDSVLHIYPNEPHEFAAAWGVVMQRTVDFFDEVLKR